MHRTSIEFRSLLVATVLCSMLGNAFGGDVDGFSQAPPGTSVAPPYWAQRQAPAAAPQPVAAPAMPDRYHSANAYPERQVSAVVQSQTGQPQTGALGTPPPAARPLPLSPPAANERGDERARQMKPLMTGAASLGIVLGLFLLVVWATRRGIAGGAGHLPREAVEVIGRAPFVNRQHVHLVRCGDKLLLVFVSPTGAQTLTEITDPAEVERLVGLCQGASSGGSTLRQIFNPLGNPPRDRRYFARHQDAELDFAHLEALQHAAHEGRA